MPRTSTRPSATGPDSRPSSPADVTYVTLASITNAADLGKYPTLSLNQLGGTNRAADRTSVSNAHPSPHRRDSRPAGPGRDMEDHHAPHPASPPPPAGPTIQLAVYGTGNHITIITPGPGGMPAARLSPWRRARTMAVDLAIIAGAVAAILTLLL